MDSSLGVWKIAYKWEKLNFQKLKLRAVKKSFFTGLNEGILKIFNTSVLSTVLHSAQLLKPEGGMVVLEINSSVSWALMTTFMSVDIVIPLQGISFKVLIRNVGKKLMNQNAVPALFIVVKTKQ